MIHHMIYIYIYIYKYMYVLEMHCWFSLGLLTLSHIKRSFSSGGPTFLQRLEGVFVVGHIGHFFAKSYLHLAIYECKNKVLHHCDSLGLALWRSLSLSCVFFGVASSVRV